MHHIIYICIYIYIMCTNTKERDDQLESVLGKMKEVEVRDPRGARGKTGTGESEVILL